MRGCLQLQLQTALFLTMKNLLIVILLIVAFNSCINRGEQDNSSKAKTDRSSIVNGADSSTLQSPSQDTATRIYKGAWFDIRYPQNFTATPSLKSATNSEGFESAFFTSPDGEASFYVFSPQWSGDATDIRIQPGEKIISKDSSYTPQKRARTINWTIEAGDKSYRRSYQEIKMDENINWIFGFKYKDEASYNKYKEQYLRFKNSIIQYGD